MTATINIRTLDKLDRSALAEAGGKAVNLGEMIAAGLPVPSGFVVLTRAYKEHITTNRLDQFIADVMSSVCIEEAGSLERASMRIRQAFTETPITEDLRTQISDAYYTLACGSEATAPAVAVRSSATVEDLPGLSFAGQYDTFLNVRGVDEVAARVVECWASLWNARAISYRMENRLRTADIAHGVVIQKLVDSEVSGILFTANPVNGRRDQLLLNASWGLGEAIVGGEVTPDQWVISKTNGSIVSEHLAEKRVMTVRTADGIECVEVPAHRQSTLSLTAEQRDMLLLLAERAEAHFGAPQDIEWACTEGEFFLVQSRPITSLYPVPETEPGKPGVRIYINFNSYSQAMQEPFTVVGEDLIRRALANVRRELGPKKIPENSLWYLKSAAGRFFIDITPFLRREKFWAKFRKPDSTDKDPVTTRALLQYLESNRDEVLSHRESVSWFRIMNPRLIRFLWRGWREYSFGKRNAVEARTRAVASGDEAVERIQMLAAGLNSSCERIDFLKNHIHDVFMAGAGTLFGVAPSAGYVARVRSLMEKHLGDSTDLELVEKAVPHSVTTTMGLEIMSIAADCDRRGVAPSVDEPAIQQFLLTYGHKKAIELDAGTPTWAENPSYVVDLVRSYMCDGIYRKRAEEFEANRAGAESAIEDICSRFVEAGRPRQARRVRRLLRDFREMFGIREQSKFVITQGLQIVRTVLHDIGHDLVAEGRIDNTSDVFHLSIADIESTHDLRTRVEENREQYARNTGLKAPRLLTSTGETIHSHLGDDSAGDSLTGIPVSPGVAEGCVRVLRTPEEGSNLEPGDILVTAGTNPSWTPLFLNIGGLIMETGGPISHGSVVAREYGVPAVSGILDATQKLRTGQRVRVNGETGRVEILEENGSQG